MFVKNPQEQENEKKCLSMIIKSKSFSKWSRMFAHNKSQAFCPVLDIKNI